MSLASVIGALRVNLSLDSAEFSSGVGKTEASSKRLKTVVAGAAASAVSAGAAITAFGAKAIATATELKNFTSVANASLDEFQRWEAGAKSVGIGSEKLADILKDVNDKVGDYMSTGGGEMADFFENIAPKVGVTADAFRNLSGPQALQLYVSSLEKAGLSQAEMTFYLEAIANDATALVPLLRNGGAEMTRLGDAAKASGAVMSQATSDSLLRAKASITEMKTALGGIGMSMIASVAPAIENGAAAMADFVKNSEGLKVIGGLMSGTLSAAATALTAILSNVGTVMGVVASVAAGRLAASLAGTAASMTLMNLSSLRFIAGMTAGAIAMRAQAAAAGVLRVAYAALGGPIGIIVTGLGLMTMGFMKAKQRAEEQRKTVQDLKDAYAAYEVARDAANKERTVETLEDKRVAAQEKLNLLIEREAQILNDIPRQNIMAQIGDRGAANKVGELKEELKTVRDDIISTNWMIQNLGSTLSESGSAAAAATGSKVLTKELTEQLEKLKEATAQKEIQMGLDALASQYGQESRIYKEAVAAADRDREMSALNLLASQVAGNAEAEKAVQHAQAQVEAEYNSAVAGIAYSKTIKDRVASLNEETANKTVQLNLDAIALQYGAESLTYKEAVAAATRDQELATLNALAAQVEGNAEAAAAVDHAINVANATYDAEVAGYAFANAMASVNAQVRAIDASLAAISGFQIQAAAAKVETTALAQGKSLADAAKAGLQAQRNAEYGEKRKAIIAQYAGEYDSPAYKTAIRMLGEEESAANAAAAAQDALGKARDEAGKKEREAMKAAGGGGSSKKSGGGRSGGGGRSVGKPKLTDEEREQARTIDRQSDAMTKLIEEHDRYRATLGMTEQQERIYRAAQETGAIGDETKIAQVRQLVIETDALKRAQDGLREVVDTLDKGFGDMFKGFITGATSARDAAKNLLSQLGNLLANSAWNTLWKGTGSWGGIGDMLTGWFGGIGQNANGTSNWAGGLTWVGERGPELVNLSRGSQILSNPASRRLVEGSGGVSRVEISISDGVEARIISQANDNAVQIVKGGLASYDKKQTSSTFNRNSADPRSRG
ncbi:hypothetical protein [Paracoccus sulfuroxidans]|uniref:Tail length tape measure protein n=1 Tax=Paracoccus sulfuroxidans TaxID=384678 RepID=A0A562P170_9RHOB|nr:hypothetical protein [Paracoccus sulfuroxidans]TWI38227.1 hypothetical protein IQ24_00365 [Paracoccus sulfuroxidans]